MFSTSTDKASSPSTDKTQVKPVEFDHTSPQDIQQLSAIVDENKALRLANKKLQAVIISQVEVVEKAGLVRLPLSRRAHLLLRSLSR
jgi:hypothetical protein